MWISAPQATLDGMDATTVANVHRRYVTGLSRNPSRGSSGSPRKSFVISPQGLIDTFVTGLSRDEPVTNPSLHLDSPPPNGTAFIHFDQ
jgi:hypothetical protein